MNKEQIMNASDHELLGEACSLLRSVVKEWNESSGEENIERAVNEARKFLRKVNTLPPEAIETLIARSSLGTPEAVALRKRTPPERTAKILARVEELNGSADISRQAHDQPTSQGLSSQGSASHRKVYDMPSTNVAVDGISVWAAERAIQALRGWRWGNFDEAQLKHRIVARAIQETAGKQEPKRDLCFASTIANARAFAVAAHGDQKYGQDHYVRHLDEVYGVACDLDAPAEVRIASYLHDTIEDTGITSTDISWGFGEEVATLVLAVTNKPGKNRRERHALTYPGIRAAGSDAVLLKLCDRIANVRASIGTSYEKMYAEEYPAFREALYHKGEHEKAWGILDLWGRSLSNGKP